MDGHSPKLPGDDRQAFFKAPGNSRSPFKHHKRKLELTGAQKVTSLEPQGETKMRARTRDLAQNFGPYPEHLREF